jgi:uncharacterized protein (DUF4415 family)
MSSKDVILRWARNHTDNMPGCNVQNFSQSWADGFAMAALFYSLAPEQWRGDKPFEIGVKEMSRDERLIWAFKAANNVGIESFMEAEDVDSKRPDDKSMLLFLTQVYKFFNGKGSGCGSTTSSGMGMSIDQLVKESEAKRKGSSSPMHKSPVQRPPPKEENVSKVTLTLKTATLKRLIQQRDEGQISEKEFQNQREALIRELPELANVEFENSPQKESKPMSSPTPKQTLNIPKKEESITINQDVMDQFNRMNLSKSPVRSGSVADKWMSQVTQSSEDQKYGLRKSPASSPTTISPVQSRYNPNSSTLSSPTTNTTRLSPTTSKRDDSSWMKRAQPEEKPSPVKIEYTTPKKEEYIPPVKKVEPKEAKKPPLKKEPIKTQPAPVKSIPKIRYESDEDDYVTPVKKEPVQVYKQTYVDLDSDLTPQNEDGDGSLISEISEKMYLGNRTVVSDANLLNAHRITHLIQLRSRDELPFEDEFTKTEFGRFTNRSWVVRDDPDFELFDLFDIFNNYIVRIQQKSARNKILIYDTNGTILAPTLMAAYLIREKKMDWKTALNTVKAKSKIPTRVHKSFQEQLDDYEYDLKENPDI